jgi:hypothetical protein
MNFTAKSESPMRAITDDYLSPEGFAEPRKLSCPRLKFLTKYELICYYIVLYRQYTVGLFGASTIVSLHRNISTRASVLGFRGKSFSLLARRTVDFYIENIHANNVLQS